MLLVMKVFVFIYVSYKQESYKTAVIDSLETCVFRKCFQEESLFIYHRKNVLFCSNRRPNLTQLLLLHSGYIELCPGPIREVKEMKIFKNMSLLSAFFQSFKNYIDIFSLSEMHLTNDNNISLYKIPE